VNRPDTHAQDQLLPIITFGLQRAAGPYRWANTRHYHFPISNLLLLLFARGNVGERGGIDMQPVTRYAKSGDITSPTRYLAKVHSI
jgi:hypothetical protein